MLSRIHTRSFGNAYFVAASDLSTFFDPDDTVLTYFTIIIFRVQLVRILPALKVDLK